MSKIIISYLTATKTENSTLYLSIFRYRQVGYTTTRTDAHHTGRCSRHLNQRNAQTQLKVERHMLYCIQNDKYFENIYPPVRLYYLRKKSLTLFNLGCLGFFLWRKCFCWDIAFGGFQKIKALNKKVFYLQLKTIISVSNQCCKLNLT